MVKIKKQLTGKAGSAFETMPSLSLSDDDGFDPDNCQVYDWMRSRPEIMAWAFQIARTSGRVRFNVETKKWEGARHAK